MIADANEVITADKIRSEESETISRDPIYWLWVLPIAAAHLGALAAPFYVNTSSMLVCIIIGWITLHFGITLGFHRLLTHGSFKTFRIIRFILTLIGTLALQGTPFEWVGIHRQHHLKTDQEGDPHSPRQSLFWAHCGWLFRVRPSIIAARNYTADLQKDPALVWLDRLAIVPPVMLLWLLFVIGGWPWLLWGGCVRLVATWHFTWLVNSAAHRHGYQTHGCDESRNNWWVALLTFGEGWHNNHHADPTCAAHGRARWEFDPTYWSVLLLERIGCAWHVRHPTTSE